MLIRSDHFYSLSARRSASSRRRLADRLGYLLLAAFLLAVALLYALPARAGLTVNVDDRVSVEFTPMIVGQTVKTYSTFATVTNVSNSPILPPIRLLITDIDKKNTTVWNADGLAAGGAAFVEIELAGPVLMPGESSLPTAIEFFRKAGNAGPAPRRHGWDRHRRHDRDSKEKEHKEISHKKFGSERFEDDDGHRRDKHKNEHFPTFDFDYSVEGGSSVALARPTSVPFALVPGSGHVDVAFGVSAVTESGIYGGNVMLLGPGLGAGVSMGDADGDGVFAAMQSVDTSGLGGGDCLQYSASTISDEGAVVRSPVYNLCATRYPTTIADSDTTPGNLVSIDGGTAVGNELLIFVEPGTPENVIEGLLADIGAEVVGTLLPSGMYQLRFGATLSPRQLQRLAARIQRVDGISGAGPNHVGEYTSTPSDTEFGVQHGLQLVSADSLGGTPKYVWDASAAASGTTVLVLDSGVDAGHPDLAVLPENSPGDNTDTLGHGTEMAGIIGAVTDNATGIAAMARATQIRSIKVSVDAAVTEAEMLAGFTAALPLAGPNVIVNASFSIFGLLSPTVPMCGAIDDLIAAGSVVVNSAGNDNNSTTGVWPGMCNDSSLDVLHPGSIVADPNKPSFIVVAASNCSAGACGTDSRKADSNFGAWVDIAAPGVNVRSTTLAGGYTNSNGTSAATALTSGGAAILRGCGVAAGSVFSILDLGATVSVTPDFNRINLYNSLDSQNTAPTGVGLGNSQVNENINTGGGFSIGSLSTTDGTACDAHSYAITGGADAGSFSIGGGAGDELILSAGVLDFETKSSYAVTVQSTDFYGLTTSQAFTVNVNDLDEPPTIAPQVRSIDENEPNGTNVGAPLAASDPDSGASLSFAITGGNTGGAFSIDNLGQISVANSAALDYETNPSFSLTVEVTDTGDTPALTASATITVNLNDLAEAIPNPVLVFSGFVDYLDAFSNPYRRWEFDVSNAAAFPVEMFEISASYPCLPNPTASRSLVVYYDAATDTPLYSFCALSDPTQMNGTWFARPQPGGTGPASPPPPAAIYMKIIDQLTGLEYQSNTITGLPNP